MRDLNDVFSVPEIPSSYRSTGSRRHPTSKSVNSEANLGFTHWTNKQGK